MNRIAIMGVGMVGGALDRYFKTQNIQAGLFDPAKELSDPSVLREADVIFVAVPTPYYLDGSGFDDSFIRQAVETIPTPGKTIVLKSTILPGTTEHLQSMYPMHRFLFNPEFLTETTVDHDMQHPNRQIVGYTRESRRDAELVMGLLPHAPFEKIMPAREAELVKYVGNAFYSLKVAYANQMFDLCDRIGADYDRVKECVKAEPWMGTHHWEIFHKGYRGYGGKCLPKDTRAIAQLAERHGIDLSLLRQAESYNNALSESQGIDIRWEEGSPAKHEAVTPESTDKNRQSDSHNTFQFIQEPKMYLVTGGAGFIGSHVVDALIAEGHRVRVVDNFSSGKREQVHPRAELFEADIADLESIRPAFVGVHGVFHLAARPSVPYSVEYPIESAQTNVMGTLNVLTAARDAGVRRVVYSASSSAYGTNEPPHRPDMTPEPLSPYAIQKHMGERFAEQFSHHYGLETVSLRYFNVYGPRMNDEGAYVPVFALFLRQYRAGEPLTIFGDGEQTRDFTHVHDVARANLMAMHSPTVGRGEVLNVGGGQVPTSINAIARMFGARVVNLPPRAGDIKHSQADISLTTELIGWTPRIRFDEGLRSYLRGQGIEPSI